MLSNVSIMFPNRLEHLELPGATGPAAGLGLALPGALPGYAPPAPAVGVQAAPGLLAGATLGAATAPATSVWPAARNI
eukprot:g27884.t1